MRNFVVCGMGTYCVYSMKPFAVLFRLSTMGTGLGKTTPTYQLDHITERVRFVHTAES